MGVVGSLFRLSQLRICCVKFVNWCSPTQLTIKLHIKAVIFNVSLLIHHSCDLVCFRMCMLSIHNKTVKLQHEQMLTNKQLLRHTGCVYTYYLYSTCPSFLWYIRDKTLESYGLPIFVQSPCVLPYFYQCCKIRRKVELLKKNVWRWMSGSSDHFFNWTADKLLLHLLQWMLPVFYPFCCKDWLGSLYMYIQ